MWERFLAQVTWPWAQPLDGSFSLKFLSETRLESKFFEPLIGFVAFTFEPETSPYSSTISNVTVTHNESAVSLVETY